MATVNIVEPIQLSAEGIQTISAAIANALRAADSPSADNPFIVLNQLQNEVNQALEGAQETIQEEIINNIGGELQQNIQSALEDYLSNELQTALQNYTPNIVSIREESQAFTVNSEDNQMYIRYTGTADIVIIVADADFEIGNVITLRQANTGTITLQAAEGVILNGGATTAGQNMSIQLIKVAENQFDVIGGIDNE